MSTIDQRHELNDADLLARCRSGDERAWTLLLERYEALVYSVPRGYGLGVEDAADVAQHTFTQLLRGLDDIRDPDALGAWLATVAKRKTWRTIARRRPDPSLDPTDPAAEHDPWHEWIDTWTDRRWVVEAVLAMPSPCRELLTALYLDPDEPTYEDVAARLERPIGSIGPTRGRCLEKLRRALETLEEIA